MQLYLVRHAEAAQGGPDELRPLTESGRDQARQVGRQLRAAGVAPGVVFTSPLRRACETGALIAAEVGAELRVDEALAPGATAEAVKQAVTATEGHEVAVAVGHQPDCSRIAAALTGKSPQDFPPGASVLITFTG